MTRYRSSTVTASTARRVRFERRVAPVCGHWSVPTWRLLDDIERGLSSLSAMPILLIWGLRDWCFRPSCLERFLTHWPKADVLRLDDCGHYVVEDAHERILPAMQRFLAAHQEVN